MPRCCDGGQCVEPIVLAGHVELEFAKALTADSLADVTTAVGRQFRLFADHSKADRAALAAGVVSSREPMRADDVRRITAPVLVAVGENDEMAGGIAPLTDLLPNGEGFVIPKRNHMLSTGDPKFKAAAIKFLLAH